MSSSHLRAKARLSIVNLLNDSETVTEDHCHLLRLPAETIEQIALLLWTGVDFSNGSGKAKDNLGLRGTCRYLYEATFRLFARVFFSTVSVVFTKASLQRLIDLSRNPRLFKVPSTLLVGPYRLPGTDKALGFSCGPLPPGMEVSTRFYSFTKLLAYSNEQYQGASSSYVQDPEYQYIAALKDQETFEHMGLDVSMLIEAMRNMPNIAIVALDHLDPSWHSGPVRHFGADMLSSTFNVLDSDLDRPSDSTALASNITLAACKILRAWKAVVSSQPQRKLLSLSLNAFKSPYRGHYDSNTREVEFSPALSGLDPTTCRQVCAHLLHLSIAFHPHFIERSTNVMDDHIPSEEPQKTTLALDALCCSMSLRELRLQLSDSPGYVHPNAQTVGHRVSRWLKKREALPELRHLEIVGQGIVYPVHIASFLAKHLTSLEVISLGPLEAKSAQSWKVVFDILPQMAKLRHFSLELNTTRRPIVYWPSREHVQQGLERMANGASIEDEGAFGVARSVLLPKRPRSLRELLS